MLECKNPTCNTPHLYISTQESMHSHHHLDFATRFEQNIQTIYICTNHATRFQQLGQHAITTWIQACKETLQTLDPPTTCKEMPFFKSTE